MRGAYLGASPNASQPGGSSSTVARSVAILRSNPVDPDPRVDKLAWALHQERWIVTLVAWDRSGLLPSRSKLPQATVIRLRIKAPFGRGLGNLAALVRWQIGLLGWLWVNRRGYDVLHACDFDTVLPALLAGRLGRRRVVYDMFDFYADMLRATPAWALGWIRRVDLWALRHVDALILADDYRRGQIAGRVPKRTVVIYNSPSDRVPVLDEQPQEGPPGSRLHLVFVGLLNVERGLLELLGVLQRHPEWSLDLAGYGGDENLILARARPLANVRLWGRIPYERALTLSAAADALVATYDPSIPNHRYASPNKLFEAMMLAKPIVVAAGTHMDDLVREHACGLVVPYGDLDALERALHRLAADPGLRTELGGAGRRAYESVYHWDIMAERLRELYRSLGPNQAPAQKE